jgi:hypothetical protein
MLQVKDPQEVFDENLLSHIKLPEDMPDEERQVILNHYYSIFILGEMYGTISTCLAQNIPIPKELWDNPTVQSFVRGDVNDVVVVGQGVKDMLEQAANIVRAEMPNMNIEVIS